MSNEIEVTTNGSDGGQTIPVRVADAVELERMIACADGFADCDTGSTTSTRGDTAKRGASKAAQT